MDLPQHVGARVRFEVKENSGTSSFIFAFASASPREAPPGIPGTVFGAVNDGAASSATSTDDFPHRVAEINVTSADTIGTSSLPAAPGQGSNERQGRGLAAPVGAYERSTAARVNGVEMRGHHPRDARQDGRVQSNGDSEDVDARPGLALLRSPCSSFLLERDDDFADAWEGFVRRDGRCNNAVCSFARRPAVYRPPFFFFAAAVFLTPLWGILFFYPLIFVLWLLGVMTCALGLGKCLLVVLTPLRVPRLPRRADVGRVRPLLLALLRVLPGCVLWGLACYCVVLFVLNMAFGVVMVGDYALLFVSVGVLVDMLVRCGVIKGGKVPALQITVEPQPPSWV